MRMMWIKRFLYENDARWKKLSKAFFDVFDFKDIFMSRCDMEFLHLKIPLFYREILLSWKYFKAFFIPSNAFEVRKEFIWFNPFIKINGNCIFYKTWYDKGIKFINDIVDENGEFFSHEVINDKFNLHTTFIDILSIRTAIPRSWKVLLSKQKLTLNSNSFKVLFIYHGKNIPISKLCTKDVYQILIDQVDVYVTSKERWVESFNIDISEEKWQSIYCLPFKCTIESKLQAFQYKILHRFASHNYLLKKYKLSDVDTCFMCNNIETLEHKYFECTEISSFWKHFADWWCIVFGERLLLTKDCVIFGFLDTDKVKENFCILLGKYYINVVKYTRTSRQKVITVQSFLNFLKKRLDFLEYIYLTKDKLNVFREVWGVFLENL